MKKQIFYFFLLGLMIINVNTLLGNSFQGEQNVKISSEVNDDLYLAGGTILIDATVRGDLVCAGGDIVLQDTITEDVLMVGGTLKILGFIGDDLRIGGGTVLIMNEIGGDLLIAGGEVTIGKDAIIHGAIQLAGGTLKMNGTVKGKANVRGGEVFWNGVAEDELIVKAGSLILNGTVKGLTEFAAQNIKIGSDAEFYKDVEYWNSEGELDFGSSLLGGATSSFNSELQIYESDINWKYLGVGLVVFWIYRLLVAALMIGLIIWMFHRFFSRNSAESNRNYASHLGFGFLFILGIPVLISLTFMSVIGIPLGFILMMFFGIAVSLGHILAALLIAYGWNHYYEKNWNRRMIFLAAMISFLALKLVGSIPFLGFLISILIVTTSFGTLLYIWWKNRPIRNSQIVD